MYDHDLVIIGMGSAGLPAGMYASRYKISNVVIGALPGGALGTSHCVENYPGTTSESGHSIMARFAEHAKASGSELLTDEVISLDQLPEGGFETKTAGGKTFRSRFALLATGNAYKKLGVPGEAEYLGRGVSYCATCDGMFFKGKTVAMVGGGDAAVTEALYLAEIAAKVFILIRGDMPRAEKIWVDKALARDNIEFLPNTEVAEVRGDVMGMTGLLLKSGETLAANGVFVAIGSLPNTKLVDHMGPAKDATGCIVVDARQATSIPGLYAAGDITTNSNKFKQTIMSAAEGCLSANSIHEDLLRSDAH
ncbi:MAG TPA: FAD-dependent oxidoreductase [bacterium]|nr:FAD-dependent oxidoreductase [bacterium]